MARTDVLLMADITDLGSEGDVVNVADGYARNYLFPKNLGAPVTEATRRKLAKIQLEREADKKAQLNIAREQAAKLEAASCTIAVKTGEDGKLYGSVAAADIIKAFKEQNVEIDKNCLLFEDHIKELGVYDINVKLHPEVTATVKVWIVEE
jgi:large subunit ribosomal protein L9